MAVRFDTHSHWGFADNIKTTKLLLYNTRIQPILSNDSNINCINYSVLVYICFVDRFVFAFNSAGDEREYGPGDEQGDERIERGLVHPRPDQLQEGDSGRIPRGCDGPGQEHGALQRGDGHG